MMRFCLLLPDRQNTLVPQGIGVFCLEKFCLDIILSHCIIKLRLQKIARNEKFRS